MSAQRLLLNKQHLTQDQKEGKNKTEQKLLENPTHLEQCHVPDRALFTSGRDVQIFYQIRSSVNIVRGNIILCKYLNAKLFFN